MYCRPFFCFFFCLLIWGFGALSALAGAPHQPPEPPSDYIRAVEIHIKDVFGRPLSGVRAALTPHWGRLATPAVPPSDRGGLIRFRLRPAAEEPGAGRLIRDRFITYRLAFNCCLTKPGYMTRCESVKDEQEFSGYADPLYQGMTGTPSRQPLVMAATLVGYEDYWPGLSNDNQKRVVEELLAAGKAKGFTLTPGSLSRTGDGAFHLGLSFNPMFDPAQYALADAAVILLREPVREALLAIRPAMNGFDGVNRFQVRVRARFQSPRSPQALPAERKYIFMFDGATAASWMNRFPGRASELGGVAASVNGAPLDLGAARP